MAVADHIADELRAGEPRGAYMAPNGVWVLTPMHITNYVRI